MKMLQPSGPAHKHKHHHVINIIITTHLDWKRRERISGRWAGPRTDRESHHLLSAAVAGAAGVAGQQVLAVGGTAARPIRRLQDMPLLGETVIKSDWVKTTGGNIELPIESFCLDGHVSC